METPAQSTTPVATPAPPPAQPQPAPATTPASAPAPTPAPAPAPAPAAAAAAEAAPATSAPSASSGYGASFISGDALQTTIQNMVEMGFEREQVLKALKAAYNNPDRAVEYLMTVSFFKGQLYLLASYKSHASFCRVFPSILLANLLQVLAEANRPLPYLQLQQLGHP